jgi:hypothetical protein
MKTKRAMQLWTFATVPKWMMVQAHLRGFEIGEDGRRLKTTKDEITPNIHAMQRGMSRHFRQTQMRVPIVPPGETLDGGLFRGVFLTASQYNALVKNKVWTDRGYMAFASRQQTALDVLRRDVPGMKKVMFVLNRRDIPKGTPWTWYGKTQPGGHLPKNKILSLQGPSTEVLLPPGMLYVRKVQINDGITYVRVTYVVLKKKRRGL